MFSIKGIFQYILQGVGLGKVYSKIESILKPEIKLIEQQQLLSKYHDVKEIYEKGKLIESLFSLNRIDKSLGTVSAWDWKREFTMRAKISGYDAISGGFLEQYVTVNSDTPLSKEEWINMLEQAGSSLFGRYEISVKSVSDFQYFIRNRK